MVDLPAFILRCAQHAGGLSEARDGLIELLVSDPLRECLGAEDVALLALDAETASRHREALPALPGSQTLDALVEYAGRQGRLTQAFPRVEGARPRPLTGEILHALTFSARRVRVPEGTATLEQSSVAQFDFVLSLVSDEREETLQSVVVDLWTGRASEALTRVVHGLEVDPRGSNAGRRAGVSLDAAFETACRTVERWWAGRIELRQALTARRLQGEHARLSLYYDGLVEDLERRQQRAREAGDVGDKAAALEEKIAATRAEREAKLEELKEKYRLRPSARLAAVRLLAYPRLYATVGLDRKQATRELEVCWDPLLARLHLPACEACGAETAYLDLGLDGVLRCAACAAPPKEAP